jgi:phage tail sheath protein FI
MPVRPTYPGVYIQEQSSGVRTIVGVSTSVAAFVDSFQRGPLNEAVRVFNIGEFDAEFGGLDANSEASYAIQQMFQNGGSEAWVVRVGEGTIAPATWFLPDEAGANVLRARAGRQIRGETALNPGAWGNNLLIEVDYDCADPTTEFNLTVSEVVTLGGARSVLRTETFRNLGLGATAANPAVAVVNEGSRLIQLDVPAGAPANRPTSTGTLGNAATTIPNTALERAFTVAISGIPAPLAAAPALIDYGTAGVPTGYPELRPFLEDAIRRVGTALIPEPARSMLTGATVKLIGRGTTAAPYRFHVQLGRTGPGFTPAAVATFAGLAAVSLGIDATGNVQQLAPQVPGNDGTTPVSAATLIGSRAPKTGLYALEDVDLFNILCIPRAAQISTNSGADMRLVFATAEAYCEERRAFLLVDIPTGVRDLDAMQTWMTANASLRHRNAAVYFPRTFVADPLANNRLRSIAASGTIAGLYARTDAERGVWKAPAGTEARLRNVQSLEYMLTDPQNGALNPLGVNCLRSFPVFSHVCWGARTLDGADVQASEWKYIPVRRLALYIEESLFRGSQWAVFEPNGQPLWAQLRLNVGAFMHNLFRQGAFHGRSPQEAYLVKCDAETTTQNDIDQGIVNIVVGFRPLKPAEFVIITIRQLAGQNET